ncbi:hypothetical protein [Cryobacterium sp. SO1]|uniref:hypothetical protein n=1 Tax=Cryobacterium sp. SO1 TaxID=1897061 RepID=UPI001023AA17|nr:hypothetical protein [Cryobacterium sp. SO1]RZI36864.1 hypothetical protein BJQ95_00743 [Cryobacterium sp. SO1]
MSRALPVLLVCALALGGCASTSAPSPDESTSTNTAPAARTIYGVVDVALTSEQFDAYSAATIAYIATKLTDPLGWPDDCVSSSSFSDVAEGAQITATDSSGEIVAIGNLDEGSVEAVAGVFYCEFAFTIDDMVLSEKFYGLSVGNVFRGDVQFTEEDMRVGPHLYLG